MLMFVQEVRRSSEIYTNCCCH